MTSNLPKIGGRRGRSGMMGTRGVERKVSTADFPVCKEPYEPWGECSKCCSKAPKEELQARGGVCRRHDGGSKP